jgi:hypothetical protein
VVNDPIITILQVYQVDYTRGVIHYRLEARNPETGESFQVCLCEEEFRGNFEADWALLTYWDKHRPFNMNRTRKILQMAGPAANRAAWYALPNTERAECVKSPNIGAVPVKSSEISRAQQ